MKPIRRPRFWIAVITGMLGALLIWMLPPQPDFTVRFPNLPKRPVGNPFALHGLTSNARFFVTYDQQDEKIDSSMVRLWDRERGFHEAVFAVRPPDNFNTIATLFSPDETQLALVFYIWPKTEHKILLFDLESGRQVKEWSRKCDHVLFAADGRLLEVDDRVLRDLDTRKEIRRLPENMGDFTFGESMGAFAVYRHKSHVRLVSWLTGETAATHDLVGNLMAFSISRDAQVMEGMGWPPGKAPWTASPMIRVYRATGDAQVRIETDSLNSRVLSPDGAHMAQFIPPRRPDWLAKFWPVNPAQQNVHVKHGPSGREIGVLGHAVDARFSPDSSVLAVVHDDASIGVHTFPFRTPWGTMAIAAIGAASLSWCTAWLWARWRTKRSGGAA